MIMLLTYLLSGAILATSKPNSVAPLRYSGFFFWEKSNNRANLPTTARSGAQLFGRRQRLALTIFRLNQIGGIYATQQETHRQAIPGPDRKPSRIRFLLTLCGPERAAHKIPSPNTFPGDQSSAALHDHAGRSANTNPVEKERPAMINLIGKKFGRLTVLEFADMQAGRSRYLCQCECGKTKIVRGDSLTIGDTKSCGCYRRVMMDLIGKKFGRLTVLDFVDARHRNARWLCQCECGRNKVISGYSLKSGDTKSCGCYRAQSLVKRLFKHGHTPHGNKTSEYRCWENARQRCFNPRHPDYKNYGARGITMCESWRYSFKDFLRDMGRRPSGHHSIERTDNEGNYEPTNCIWATAKDQALNRRPRDTNG